MVLVLYNLTSCLIIYSGFRYTLNLSSSTYMNFLEHLLHPAQKTNPSKRTLKITQRIPLRCKHRRGVTRRTTVVRSRARPPEPRPTMAIHNKKDGRIPRHIAEKHLLRRHLTKYKAY